MHSLVFLALVLIGLHLSRSSCQLSQSDHLELIRQHKSLFANRTLVISMVVREPFVIFNEPPELSNASQHLRLLAQGDLDNYSGVAIEVVKRLRSIFEFKTIVRRPADAQFGVYSSERREWTGLMGDLVRRRADIGVTALSITMSRAQAIDFTRAYFVETAAILLKIPDEVDNYSAIFQPFSGHLWFVLLATILSLIFLVTIMTKLEDQQHEQDVKLSELQESIRRLSNYDGMDTSENVEEKSIVLHRHIETAGDEKPFGNTWVERFYYAVTCVINILLIRDIKHPPKQTPIRLLVCVWWLSTIVIVNIYLGILFGQLVVPQRPRTIETLEELVSQSQITWCVTQGSAIYDLFKQSEPSSVYGQLGARMRNVSSADEGVSRVINSGWAFIREKSILTFKVAVEHNRLRQCRMQLAREEFYSVGFGIGLVKNSSFLKPFNSAMTLMIENGFVPHWESMNWPRRNEYTECDAQATDGEPLTLKHFISIYLVCSVIISISAFVIIYQLGIVRLIKENKNIESQVWDRSRYR